MFCTKCGASLEDTVAFCNKCGAPVVAVGDADISAIPVPALAAYKAKNRRTGAIAAGIVGVLALVGVGFLAYTLFLAPFNIDEKTFPDAALRSYVAKTIDTDGDGKVTRDEAKEVKSINLSGSKIASLVGMEIFKNLTELDLSGTPLTEANLSSYKQLEKLDASGSALQSIDLGVKPEFEYLDLSETKVSEVDFSGCGNLKKVDLSKTAVEKVDASACSALEELNLRDTSVSDLTIGGKDALQRADLANTKLSVLDVSGCIALQELNLEGSAATELNISGCTALESLRLDGSQLSSVNVDGCISLANFQVGENVTIDGMESAGLREQWLLVGMDVNGRDESIVERVAYHGDSSPNKASYRYSYDEQSRLTNVEYISEYDSRSEDYFSTYSYTGNSMHPDSKTITSSSLERTVDYVYNEAGMVVQCVIGDTDEATTFSYEYDEMDNLTTVESVRDGKKIGHESFSYESNQLVKHVSDNVGTFQYSYNEDGMLEKALYSDNSQSVDATQCEYSFGYDDNGHCVQASREYRSGKAIVSTEKLTLSYSEQGLIDTVAYTRKDASANNTNTATFKCMHDNHGNISKIEASVKGLWDWTRTFNYKRVITKTDAPEVFLPIADGNPATKCISAEPAFDFSFMKNQSPVIQNFFYANYVYTLGMY